MLRQLIVSYISVQVVSPQNSNHKPQCLKPHPSTQAELENLNMHEHKWAVAKAEERLIAMYTM